jgi:hypothetical protein
MEHEPSRQFSLSEIMFHKDNDHKGSIAKKNEGETLVLSHQRLGTKIN